jgi:L,D-transpeptidase catalytic domain
LETFRKVNTGAASHGLIAATLAAGALFVAGATDAAQAQLFPWGGWQGPSPWQAERPRPQRRIPRNIPDDGEKITSTLPKPTGPLVIVVALGKQTVSLYDGTTKIATSPISSGMSGRETPTGIFSILEKNRYHYSNLYGGAPMPYMNRITNSGVAMHEGVVPGYPASHGCIRLPGSFARNLFGITEIGARVIVTQDDLTPTAFESAHLIAPLPPDQQASNRTQDGASAETASATGKDVPNLIGVTPALAESGAKPRTREAAAAARAAERVQLANAITEAGEHKTAAAEHAKALADAAHAAKDEVRKARNEHEKLNDAARKAAREAENGADKFREITAKMSKVEVDKLSKDELEKQSADELAEETKVLDLADAVGAAERAVDQQKGDIDKAVAAAADAEKAARAAAEDVKTAEKAVVDAKAALAEADAIEKRKDNPVSIFISRKTGRLEAKLGIDEPVIDVPVKIADPDTPLGTHVFTATGYTDGEKNLHWTVVTLSAASSTPRKTWRRHRHDDQEYVATASGDNADPESALERIEIPKETAERLAELMKPGSSFIISDYGLSRETSKRTEFVVEPWRSASAPPVEYEGGRRD